jgi:hypothetical protein
VVPWRGDLTRLTFPQDTAVVTDTTFVTIALVPDLGNSEARAVIIRRSKLRPQNIILVTARTEAADLTKAVNALVRARNLLGDSLPRDMKAFITPAKSKPQQPSRDTQQAAIDLRRLATLPPSLVNGVGTYPALITRIRPSKRPR